MALTAVVAVCTWSAGPAAFAAPDPQAQVVQWADAVQPGKVWTITFNSPVDVLTVTPDRVSLLDTSGQTHPVRVTTALDGMSISIEPVTALPAGDYRLRVLEGIKDTAGQALQAPVEIDFSVTAASIAESLAGQETSSSIAPAPGRFAYGLMSAAPVDLAISGADLTLPTEVTGGAFMSIRMRVHNASPGQGLAGGSVVRVTVAGRVVDEIPFYLAAGQADRVVTARYYLPAGPYKSLEGQERATVQVTATVDPYGKTPETDEGNNIATGSFTVRPDNDVTIQETAPPMTVDAAGLSVWSTKDDAADDRIQAALPGQTLHLAATIACPGADATEDINVKFLVNGVVVLDDDRHVVRPASGSFQVTDEYVVPHNATGPLTFQVLLSNGSAAAIKVPVLRWDTEVRPGDLYWSSSTVAVPGQRLYLHAVIKNTSWLSLGTSDAKIACRVLVNGTPFYEHEYTLTLDRLLITVPAYLVPQDQTGPVTFTVVTDPYDQLAESDEGNNIATIEVPLVNTGGSDFDLWVSPSDLTAIARPILPGSRVVLSAAIHNRSNAIPAKDVKVHFLINGAVVGTDTISRASLMPMQARQATYTWTAPADLAGVPSFKVVIDPDNELSEFAEDNNDASEQLELAQPDLDAAAPCLTWTPAAPVAGGSVTLRAVIRNNGATAVRNAVVRFMVDGATAGDATIPVVGGSGAGVATLDWRIPDGSALGSTPWAELTGTPGKIPLPSRVTHDFAVSAVADPEQRVAESDEDNNAAAPVTMTVTVPNDKKVVYVGLTDILGAVPAATVVLQAADGTSAQTVTGDDGWCCFTGVPAGAYTVSVSKEGYKSQSASGQAGGQSAVYYQRLVMERTGDVVGLTQNDRDYDLLSDELELLYGTNPDDPDTDDDGVIDGKDLSPLVDPVEPQFESLQKVGMLRLDQPVAAYGLDGWCEVWDMDWSFSTMSDTLVLSQTYDSNGTRASTMSQDNYRSAVDRLYASSGLKSWAIKDVTPQEIGYEDTELRADGTPEDSWTYPADHFHRTEYRFYYDYVTDYQLVSLKNDSEMLYPSADSFFRYLLFPVQQLTGHTQSYKFQFTQPGLADQIQANPDGSYHELGMQYAFYGSDQFDDDSDLPFAQGMVLVDTDGSDRFDFAITLPAELATVASAYLKITPVWVSKAANNPDASVAPVTLAWDLTGLQRDVVYSQDAEGNSSVGSDYPASVAGFGQPVRSLAQSRALESDPQTRATTDWSGFVTSDPDAPDGQQITAVESDVKILSYVAKGIGGAGSGISVLVEKVVKSKTKAKKIEDLPQTHWVRGAKYNGVLMGFKAASGVVTLFSNGKDAYVAFRDGDKITGTYYVAKGIVSVGETAYSMAEVSKNIVAWGGKTGRFAKLANDKVAVGLAVAVGTVEIGYNLAKWKATSDPIKKSAYFESTFTAAIDTVLGMVSAVYGPQMLAFQVTWMVGNEIVFRFFGGDAIAYEVAKSPASAIVFIAKYWGEDVPSQLAEAAYDAVEGRLMELLKGMDEFGKPFIPVFVDPAL